MMELQEKGAAARGKVEKAKQKGLDGEDDLEEALDKGKQEKAKKAKEAGEELDQTRGKGEEWTPPGLEKQREQEQKELGRGSEQGQESREERRPYERGKSRFLALSRHFHWTAVRRPRNMARKHKDNIPYGRNA